MAGCTRASPGRWYGVNDGDRAIAALEAARRLYLERGDRRGAARVAGWLAWSYGSEHAWFAALGGMSALRGGDTAAALHLAREAAEIGAPRGGATFVTGLAVICG
jgi:Flp pilus assembly protein TadD